MINKTEIEAVTSWLDSSLSELDYAIKSNKPLKIKEHYIENAMRYINEAKELLK